MPPGPAGLNVRKTARYAGEDRDPLQLRLWMAGLALPGTGDVAALAIRVEAIVAEALNRPRDPAMDLRSQAQRRVAHLIFRATQQKQN